MTLPIMIDNSASSTILNGAFIEQLNTDCCELLEKVLANHEDKIELRLLS